jgi:hypothetical protein
MMESVFREKECPSDILNGGVPQIHIMRSFLQKDHVQNPVIYQSYKILITVYISTKMFTEALFIK